jgi:phosphoribosylamine-glycine ligase
MGYDAVEALAEGLTVPLSDFLYEVACGTATECPLADQTMIAVRLSIPPWPVMKPRADSAGERIEGIDETTLPHLFLTDLYKDNEGYKTAGGDGVLLKATAKGPSRRATDDTLQTDYTFFARKRVYELLDKIKISGRQWRVDIGARVNKEMAQLKQWGWIDG